MQVYPTCMRGMSFFWRRGHQIDQFPRLPFMEENTWIYLFPEAYPSNRSNSNLKWV